jgi:WD40 repeat protein
VKARLTALLIICCALVGFTVGRGAADDLPPITAGSAAQLAERLTLGTGAVRAAAWSIDGKTLAVGTTAGIWLYNPLAPDDPPRSFSKDDKAVSFLSFSPRGRRMASVSGGALRLWELADGSSRTIDTNGAFSLIAFSPDWNNIALAHPSQRIVELWDFVGGNGIQYLYPNDQVTALAFSPDGKTLVAGDQSGQGYIWNIQKFNSIPQPDTFNANGAINSLAFSLDNRILAVGDQSGSIQLYDLPANKQVNLADHDSAVYSLAFSPDGKTLVSGGDDATARVWALSYAPDGILADGVTRSWLHGQHISGVRGVGYSPSGGLFFSFSSDTSGVQTDNRVNLWDGATDTLRVTLPLGQGRVNSLAASPRGDLLALSGLGVELWSIEAGARRSVLGEGKNFTAAAFSPDGALLAGAGEDAVYVWDVVANAERYRFDVGQSGAQSVAFSPDGALLAAGASDGSIHTWDVATGDTRLIRSAHTTPVYAITFSPDGKQIVSADNDGVIAFWDTTSGQFRSVLYSSQSIVRSLAFSRDGKTLAASSGDGDAALWDVSSGASKSFNLPANALAFNADASLLATASGDGSVSIWLPDGSQVAQVRVKGSLSGIAFLPDGRQLAVSTFDGMVRLLAAVGEAPTAEATGAAAAPTCGNAQPARLVVGGKGQVLQQLSLRESASASSKRLALLRARAVFTVRSGPVCQDSALWYEVEYNGRTGWIAEGDPQVYFVAPSR